MTQNYKKFNFRPKKKKIIVENDFMYEIEQLALAAHSPGGFLVWYGSAGVGKTTTADWMIERINQSYDHNNPDAFRAALYLSGKIENGNEAKRAIRAFFTGITGTVLDEKLYWRNTVEDLADLAVHALKRLCMEIVYVDEAGLISVDGLSGLALISDKAIQLKHPLTIVLIGMDNLQSKLDEKHRPQLFRRVLEWCLFQHYTIEDTYSLLAAIHPHFAGLDQNKVSDWEQIKFVHEISGGLPGFILPFVSRFAAQYTDYPYQVDLRLLMAIHKRSRDSYKGIVNQSNRNGRPIKDIEQEPGKGAVKNPA